jgi:predicted membrane-bound spermidine synthase
MKTRAEILMPWWLMLAVVVSGALIMAVELIGVRILSTAYGASLAVWGAMITVVLLSLAGGYFVGGWLADRFPRPGLVAGAALAAAALVGVIPWLRPVLRACHDVLGMRCGAAASSMILFFLPLGCAAMIPPFAVKLWCADTRRLGVSAGGIYAASTLGSVVGTLLTAFWLIPTFGLATCLRAVALLAAAVGVLGLVLSHGPRGMGAFLLGIPLLVSPGSAPRAGESYRAPDGERILVEDIRDSLYGRLIVLRKGLYRLLVADGIVQTGMPVDPSQIQKGQGLQDRYLQELIPYMTPEPSRRKALIIGLAGGMTAAILKQHGMEVDAVELDPVVAGMAGRWFGFGGQAIVADGRRYMETSAQRYDVCVLDAYAGDGLPGHLATVEAFRAARRMLRPGGALVMNFIGAPGGDAFASVCRTLNAVFPNLLALRSEPGDDVQPITLFAADAPIEFSAGWRASLDNTEGVDPVRDTLSRLALALPQGRGAVLTDDYNPIDGMRASEALRWREKTAENIGTPAGF